MKQTVVEWLQSGLELIMSHEEQMQAIGLFEQAKEMEKQQQYELAIEFANWCKDEDTQDLLHDLIIVGEIDKNVTIEKLLEIFKNK